MNSITAIFETQDGARAAATELERMGLSTDQLTLSGGSDSASVAQASAASVHSKNMTDVAPPQGGLSLTVTLGDLAEASVVDVLQRHGGHIY